MPNLKKIRKHILSVQNTAKITKAMKMVAVSKLRKSQQAVVSTRPYVNELINIIEHLVLKCGLASHPLLRETELRRRCVLVVISGDRGLCGAYNHNIVKSAKRFIAERREHYEELELVFVGRKAYDAMKREEGVRMHLIEGAWSKTASELGLELSKRFCEDFSAERLDEVYVLYTKFKSAISQNVILDAILPLQLILQNEEQGEDDESSSAARAKLENIRYLYEPSQTEILDILLPRAVSIHLQRSLLESLASENGARMTAMDNASTNAEEMIRRLRLQYNRARQAAITTELIEVVSGAEAL